MAMASVPGRPKRVRQDPIGTIGGKTEIRRAFNNFPAIARAFPEVISAIVVETTNALGELAQAKAPVQPSRGRPWRLGDASPGTLKRSMKVRFAKRRGTDIVLTGRVDFKAVDPSKNDAKHTFAKAVEVGSTRNHYYSIRTRHYRVPAQPFLVPAIVVMRPIFIANLQTLESRLPQP